MKILNLTQHGATPEQIEVGVYEPNDKSFVCTNLTFDEIPQLFDVKIRATVLAEYAQSMCATHVMIGGAPFLMSLLEAELLSCGIKPLYAFSKRESVDMLQDDGSVKKVAVFKHVGFVEVE